MKRIFSSLLLLLNFVFTPASFCQDVHRSKAAATLSPGAALLPVPRNISLADNRYKLDETWSVAAASNLSNGDPAILSLTSELKGRFGLRLKTGGRNTTHTIQLVIRPGSVTIGETTDTNRTALKQQAYNLKLEPGKIIVTANGRAGLFYGVQTLIQLLQLQNGNTYFPTGTITDWPDMDVRMVYWDDAHHLERLDAIKRAIKQASYYKINAFTVKLEGHFQFKSAPAIVEPYAYTPAEFQELTDFAKAHYVELIPYIDAPAHISFILKHPEYQQLRSFPNSNYEFSVLSSEADELLLGMFDDLFEANKGGKYVFLSTDEAYYVGKSEGEKKRAAELGGNGKLLAEYITRISNKLHAKGRKVIIWGEYPLRPEDVTSLPSHLINGINGNSEEYGSRFKEHGIRHLVFTSAQGEEPLFPNYYKLPEKKAVASNTSLPLTDDELQQGDMSKGRVGEVLNTITTSIRAGKSDFMGVVVCGWADAGLNTETFWLGYATGCAAAWNTKSADAKDLSNRFYLSFYGDKIVQMGKLYELISTQAQHWRSSWDWAPSKNRTPIFGYSAAVFETPRPAKDQTLPPLPVPSVADLSFNNTWNTDNAERLETTRRVMKENQELMNLLDENLVRVDYQQYNLQVFRTIAEVCRQNLRMLLKLERANNFIALASSTASADPNGAVAFVDMALDEIRNIREERNQVLGSVSAVWYQRWFPLVPEANGRKFLLQVDDVKDHPPVRTVDISYLVYRQIKYPLGKWAEDVTNARNQFAKKNNLPVKSGRIDWEAVSR